MKLAPVLLSACLLSAGCLDNEETIEVHPDGSVRVTHESKGDPRDLLSGFAMPMGGPWRPLNRETQAWIQAFGPATGGAEVRARFEAGALDQLETSEKESAQLRVVGEFATLAELPTYFAPKDQAYRSALLERRSKLSIQHKGARRVYVFERTYGGRPFWSPFDERIPEDIIKVVEDKRRPSPKQIERFTKLAREWVHAPESMRLITSAMGAAYTEGDAGLSSIEYKRALERLHASIDRVLSIDNVGVFFDALTQSLRSDSKMAADRELGQQLRDAAREVIVDTFKEEGLRHAVLERLEWNFSSHDLAEDIKDESFILNVKMPGTIVDGNFDSVSGSMVKWEFDGKQLRGSERKLRVVSVLD